MYIAPCGPDEPGNGGGMDLQVAPYVLVTSIVASMVTFQGRKPSTVSFEP